jgi:hypothetical protein
MSSEVQEQEPAVIHRQTSPDYDVLGDNVFYPINHSQVRDLLGRVLTHLDAMGLPERSHRAAKTLLTRDVWAWWSAVHENATTSYKGCIAPVVTAGGTVTVGLEPSNRWGFPSEVAYLDTARRDPAAGTIA